MSTPFDMPHSFDPDLIDRYLTGQASHEEADLVRQWLGSTQTIREAADYPGATRDIATKWTAMASAMGHATPVRPTSHRASSPKHSSGTRRWLRFSLGIAATIVTVFTVERIFTRQFTPQQSARVYTTETGQRAHVVLQDGSQADLAPRSKLIVSPQFGHNMRTVTVVGQAFFQVTPKHNAPFVVQTGSIDTRVLGTSFDVRRYPDDDALRVTVLTGRVLTSVRAHTPGRAGIHTPAPLIIAAGMTARVNDSLSTLATTQDAGFSDWRDGRLTFRGTSVTEMLAGLNRWYGYQFKLGDSTIARQRVTAVFDVAKPDEMLTALGQFLDVTVTVNGQVVTLNAHPTTRKPAPRRTWDKQFFQAEVGK